MGELKSAVLEDGEEIPFHISNILYVDDVTRTAPPYGPDMLKVWYVEEEKGHV